MAVPVVRDSEDLKSLFLPAKPTPNPSFVVRNQLNKPFVTRHL